MFGVGTEPPPDSNDPSAYVAMSVFERSAFRSAWVIWPTFSASVIRPSRSLTRVFTGSFLFRYGRSCALMTTCGVAVGASRR